MSKDIEGTYKHFKGGLYEVLEVVKHSETLGELVIYRHKGKKEKWARPYDMFFEEIERDGKTMKRFEKVD